MSTTDDALAVARAIAADVEAIKKPRPRVNDRHDFGDGDRCPSNPEHGKMYVFGSRQYCSHSDHDGKPLASPLGRIAPSPAWFPLYP